MPLERRMIDHTPLQWNGVSVYKQAGIYAVNHYYGQCWLTMRQTRQKSRSIMCLCYWKSISLDC